MRPESELFKDKAEITLEGRQVFYLFFGGAVIASLVFVLGVMVGKRVEARAHVGDTAGTTAASDPLAALDELGAEPGAAGLTYAEELTRPLPAVAPAPPVPAPEPRAEPEGKAEDKSEPKADAKREPEPKAEADSKSAGDGDAEVEKPESKPDSKPEADKRKYTLQLSSFRDRAEAEQFMAQVSSAGYRPYITEAAVDGKGTWYRVRLGTYASYDEALEAKSKFETAQKMIAYVTRAR